MRKEKLENNEIYHIYNRGVEKRNLFCDKKDYYRFIHNLFEFNDKKPVLNVGYYFENNLEPVQIKPRKLLVEILAFCLMPNHFHLLLRQKVDNGITTFMRKLGTGYTNYFNQKHTRVGPLFQGAFKSKRIKNQIQLLYIPHYIHLNPLDIITPEWRENKLKNLEQATTFLNSYKWSSYLDYAGEKNFPSVTNRNYITQMYGSGTSIDYKTDLIEWLKNLETGPIKDTFLE
jgi:putative transposase